MKTDVKAHLEQLATRFGMEAYISKIQTDTVMSDGFRLHLDVMVYDRNAPTLVFVPGTATYALCFAQLLSRLFDAGFNIVGIDPRGHGQSEGRRGDYTIAELVRDTQAAVTYAIQNFNERVSVMGCSQGGVVAFYTAATDDRLQSAICQNIADLVDPRTAEVSRFPRLTRIAKPALRVACAIAPSVRISVSSYIDHRKMHVAHYGNIKNFIKKDPIALKAISIRALHSLINTPLSCQVEQIKTPIMVLHPAKDQIFSLSYTRYLFNRLQCPKQLEIFPDLDHVMMVNHPEKIAPPVIQWLQTIYGKA